MVDQDPDAELTWASERHLRLCFGEADSPGAHARVHQALAAIQQARLHAVKDRPETGPPLHGLVEITPSYSTILLEFSLGHFVEQQAVDAVRRALTDAGEIPERPQAPVIDIPVCYEPPCAPDAENVARIHGIDVPALIRMHSQPLYIVQFIGFAPGFGYLSGLPNPLATPRLATPRVRVPAGSVGIAGQQTGIYPAETAGGWRLIGRTPLMMFDAGRKKPSLLAAGDRVRFVPIGVPEFNAGLRELTNHE